MMYDIYDIYIYIYIVLRVEGMQMCMHICTATSAHAYMPYVHAYDHQVTCNLKVCTYVWPYV